MRVPISWLREFVPFKMKTGELAHRMTMAGFEIEQIVNVAGEEVLEVNITPNRGDCLSIQGMARELAAILRCSTQWPRSQKQRGTLQKVKSLPQFKVTVSAKKECPRYAVLFMDNIAIGPSPGWLQDRLSQVGVRSINNVVDLTNYLLWETGQPLHAFDLDKIRGNVMNVRRALPEEKFLDLRGEEHQLSQNDLVVADAEGPMALAGVIGGKDSEVDEGTKRVAIECAFFNPDAVRSTARRLGIATESSYRFSRGVDPSQIAAVLQRISQLMLELAAGSLISGYVDISHQSVKNRAISFHPSSIRRLVGTDWKLSEMKQIFQALGFRMAGSGDRWRVTVPAFRWDLSEEIDLVEEVVRLGGIGRIPETFPALKSGQQEVPVDFYEKRKMRRLLAGVGLSEAIHYSFMDPEDLRKFDERLLANAVTLANPLGLADSILRPSLLPTLLKTVAYHHHHKILDVRLYEWRKVFQRHDGDPSIPSLAGTIEEPEMIALALSGRSLFHHWSGKGDVNFYELKGVVERLLSGMGVKNPSMTRTEQPFLHPGKSATLSVDGMNIGFFGELHPEIAAHFDLRHNIYLGELSWAGLRGHMRQDRSFRPYSMFPWVERDLSVLVDQGVTSGALQEAILQAGVGLVQEVELFDVYQGDKIPAGKKSLAFAVRLGRNDRTLNDSQVTEMYDKMVSILTQQFNAEIR